MVLGQRLSVNFMLVLFCWWACVSRFMFLIIMSGFPVFVSVYNRHVSGDCNIIILSDRVQLMFIPLLKICRLVVPVNVNPSFPVLDSVRLSSRQFLLRNFDRSVRSEVIVSGFDTLVSWSSNQVLDLGN